MSSSANAPEEEGFISSLGADGRRVKPQPADVHGRFHRFRRALFAALLVIFVATPLLELTGHPLLLLDVPARRFTVLTLSFGPQDVYLGFFAASAGAFLLALSTSLWGRAFCGFACPQTVFLDGVFRPIERLVEGPRQARIRLDAAPLGASKLARKGLKHALFLLASAVLAHALVFLFVPISSAIGLFTHGPAAEPVVFGWVVALSVAAYVNFGLFREQFCLALCPYGRLQAALVDEDTKTVSYDAARGEPRRAVAKRRLAVLPDAAPSAEAPGDCVDCGRCVVVCPTGIDIRNGLQLDCVACTACIDACDEIMTKLARPTGLIRMESERVLRGERPAGAPFRWRPRLTAYAILGAMGVLAAGLALGTRTALEVTAVRPKGPPFVLEDEGARNTFMIHVVETAGEAQEVAICAPRAPDGLSVAVPNPFSLQAHEERELPLVATRAIGSEARSLEVEVVIGADCGGRIVRTLELEVLGP